MTNVKNATISFVACCQNANNVYFAKHYTNLKPCLFTLLPGRKFYKITTTNHGGEGQTSVFGFVDKTTGDIFKPASWNARAKHARGNVLSVGNGIEALDQQRQHVRYLS